MYLNGRQHPKPFGFCIWVLTCGLGTLSGSMGKKGTRCPSGLRISEIVPTPEEVEDARLKVANALDPRKAEASSLACFKYWLDQNPTAENAELASDVALRKRYLVQFQVLQGRDRKAQAEEKTRRIVSDSKKNRSLVGWRSWEFCCRQWGLKKMELYYKDNVIRSIPDPKTKNEDKEMRMYWYDEETEIHDHEDKDERANEVTKKADEESTKKFHENADAMSLPSAPSSAADGSKPAEGEVKKEKTVAEESMHSKCLELLAKPVDQMQTLQEMSARSAGFKLMAESPQAKYQEGYLKSLNEWDKNYEKIKDMLQVIKDKGEFNKNTVPSLVAKIEQLVTTHEEHVKHAETFGFAKASRTKRARKS